MHHCNNPPLLPSHKPSMKCYCLVAQSTMWSSCDCINLLDLISCSHEWEKNEREKKQRTSENLKLERFQKKATKSTEKKTIQICFVAPLKPSSLSFYLWFVLRTEALDMQKHRFGTALSNKSNWRSLCSTAMASKATQRPQRITLTCSYTNTDGKKVSIISVVSFIASSRLSVFLLRSQLDNKLVGQWVSLVPRYRFIVLSRWSVGMRVNGAFGQDQLISLKGKLPRRATIIGQITGEQRNDLPKEYNFSQLERDSHWT